MDKKQELNLFLVRSDELIEGKYILANVKIINLLKSIAGSETLLAIFKTCLKDFSYEKVKSECFTPSKYISGKYEYASPTVAKDLLALVFTLLMDFDSGKIDFNEFINDYFYENGSYYESYNSFIKKMIVPFKFAVKGLMESVLNGQVADPNEELLKALSYDEEQKVKKDRANEIAELLAMDVEKLKKKIVTVSDGEDERVKGKALLKNVKYEEALFITDTFIKAVNSLDGYAIKYAYIAYKYTVKATLAKNNLRKIESLIESLL